jgi:two-component system, cell cycle sensor histidine kinase and response regulator CckA
MNRTQQSESAHSAAEAPQRPSTILLVDDADRIRELIRMILRNNGYTVLQAKDGNACLKIAQEYSGPIHLLLVDMFMTGMNGREVADHLRASHHQIKVLFMSGYSNKMVQSHGGLDPGFHFITKPFTAETLLRKVSETLGT